MVKDWQYKIQSHICHVISLNKLLNSLLMEEEKKLCTPQHSVNGHVPLPNELQYDKAVCDCKKLIWIKVNTCNCQASPNWELQARPNQ